MLLLSYLVGAVLQPGSMLRAESVIHAHLRKREVPSSLGRGHSSICHPIPVSVPTSGIVLVPWATGGAGKYRARRYVC